MPYKKWTEKLARRLDSWYKTLSDSGFDIDSTSAELGIEAHFWSVCGIRRHILTKKTFHDITFYQRIWILKSLCDNCVVSFDYHYLFVSEHIFIVLTLMGNMLLIWLWLFEYQKLLSLVNIFWFTWSIISKMSNGWSWLILLSHGHINTCSWWLINTKHLNKSRLWWDLCIV